MKRYDFDEPLTRRGSNSYKWDIADSDDVLPMWVADMDFRTAPCIIDALRRRVEHGVFGYTLVPPAYYRSVCDWFSSRHDWQIDARHIIYTTGVVPALSAVIKGLTRPGDRVIVQTPAYNCFFSSIRNNGCELADNPLLYNPADGTYRMDLESLESLAADPRCTLMLLCNPHNPAGRLWSRDELAAVARICARHGVTVVSDEIHCELTYNGTRYNPYAPVSAAEGADCVVCCSPSKAFNTAGLQIANIICPNEEMRVKIDRAINDNEVCDVNPFGVAGLIAAYNEGAEWLDSLCDYIWRNWLFARDFLSRELPAFTVTPLEATYLLWLNISPTGMKSESLCRLLLDEGKVMLSPGFIYGAEGDDFVRVNLACPRHRLEEGLRRIVGVLRRISANKEEAE